MQDLIRKIEGDAETRLQFPADAGAAERLSRYKVFLKVETHRLKLWHRSGAGGREICRARAAMLDALLRHLWTTARGSLSPRAQKEFPPLALVAIGGYGRAELNPHSDIDFMFLHDGQVAAGKPLPCLSRLIDGVLYPLWDIGLKIGYAVRSLDDCVKVANTDMQSKTSLIESRLIIGDEKLFKKFQRALIDKCVDGFEEKYIALRLEDQKARHRKFGDSACMQEPNIKNGCGGLRDFQNLLWMAFFKYRARSPGDLEKQEFVSRHEHRQLEAAYDFLLRARTELHYQTNRAVDVLGKNLQPAVALGLGYGDRSPSKRIEKFMRDLYTHMRNIFLITRTLEQRMALLAPAQRKLSLRAWLPQRKAPEPVDGFLFVNGEIRAVSRRIFREQPQRLMRVFLQAQQRRLKLHPDLEQLIRNELSLVDRAFLNDAHVRETFLTILEQRGNVAPVLRAMHEVNFLGKYIPEFGKLTCLVQHEFYHQYAADEHTLVCLEQLDRVWEARELPYKNYAPLFQNLERPGLLYLALLLHDVGKSGHHKRGDHPQVSAGMAMRVARRLRLNGPTAHTLRVIIENHLLMANISQRRDLDDAAVIRNFAHHIETAEALDLLTLLTFADAQGTSDKLWNGFKDALLWQLHARALVLLTGGTEFVRAGQAQRESLLQEVRQLAEKSLSDEEINTHFGTLPDTYFQVRAAREIIEDLELAHRFMQRLILEDNRVLSPIIAWRDEADRGYNAVKICTWDRAGLFSKIAGSFSAAGLNILGAQIFTRADSIVLDAFYVNDGRTGNLATRQQHDQFAELLEKVLTHEAIDLPALIARRITQQPIYQPYTGEHIQTQIHFDNEVSETRTLIEVETEDHLGLLYMISQTLSKLAVDIVRARIVTERGAAIDSFYVREADGSKIVSPERQVAIERRLREAIYRLHAVT
ncbi:MAG TPA: [protein-PII] uridylyltransferase [Candidatus Sulfopaludibacter sp.]|nr:[protein-PII] uridylyltransferase [Candidatus Sulfopaludibacter sp.]